VSKALLKSKSLNKVILHLSVCSLISSLIFKTAVVQLLFFRKPDCFSDKTLCASIKLTIWLAINRSRTFDKKGRMAIDRYSVPDLKIGNIFAIFQDLGNVEVVMEQFKMCVITERILGRISFKNFGFISSKPVALDLMLKIDSRTSHWLTQLKLKVISQLFLSQDSRDLR